MFAGLGAATTTAHAGNLASLHLSNPSSPKQAGYELSPAPASASASGAFTVPKLTCSSTLAGIAPGSFIFTGSGVTASFLYVVCQGGGPIYQGELYINGVATSLGIFVKAGDVVSTTATESAASTKVIFKNVTRSLARTLSGPGGTPSVVLQGVDTLNNGTTLPVPTFTTISYTAGSIDAKTLKASGAIAVDLDFTPPTVNISTGTLDSTGKKFAEIFKHN